ncbi:hypothetical protein, partial [Chryseobacterium sp. CH1]|uniref:hypothetical protein n=1 Tax=Chryseobacterium sp. CH1 TaxID=713551 RepID=UPI001024EA90
FYQENNHASIEPKIGNSICLPKREFLHIINYENKDFPSVLSDRKLFSVFEATKVNLLPGKQSCFNRTQNWQFNMPAKKGIPAYNQL